MKPFVPIVIKDHFDPVHLMHNPCFMVIIERAAMRIIVKFSGLFSNAAGVDQEIVEVPDAGTIERMIEILSVKYTQLPFMDKKTYFMVNEKLSNRDKVLNDGDQVRIFQMMAGG